LISQLQTLVSKEFKIEFRNKVSITTLLVYLISTVYVCYQAFGTITVVNTWNSLFWIIVIFGATTSSARIFTEESKKQQLFYYNLVNPSALILSKIIYNGIITLGLSFSAFLIFSIFIGNIVSDYLMFLTVLFLGNWGISNIMVFISGIASKTGNQSGLSATLGLPLIIPVLLSVVKTGKMALDGLDRALFYKYFVVLIMLNLICVVLAIILFPYLWRD
jgi:heme exporter protein B